MTSKACSKAGWAKKERTQRECPERRGEGRGAGQHKGAQCGSHRCQNGRDQKPPMTVGLAEERSMSSALGNSSPRQLPIRQCSINLNPDER